MQVIFNIPGNIAQELNDIAIEGEFPNAKAMVIAYLRALIRVQRGNEAIAGRRETAELQADTDTESIT